MGEYELKLTRLKKFWFIRIPVKIRVGFLFWNEAIIICSRDLKIELKDFFDWAEKNNTLYFTQMLFAAYILWCKENYKKPALSKHELIYAFTTLPEDKQKELMMVWKDSESFGVKQEKKKVKK